MFLRNCWYVAAFGSEIGREPFARTIAGRPIVFFRRADGRPVALEDRCCHRNLPLSMGRIEGDGVRCGYHGLLFDSTGQCVEIPGQKEIPPGAQVRAYPLLERWNFLWIWLGDEIPDETLLPDWRCLDDAALTKTIGNGGKPLPMKCNWELNNDNLLDPSHTVFVHPTSLGSPGPDRFPVETDRFPRGVRLTRWMTEVTPIPLLAQIAGYDGPQQVDRWQITLCEAPNHCTVDAGFIPAGITGPRGDLDQGVRLRALMTATPETATTSFLFYQQVRNFARGDEAASARFSHDIRNVFFEDIAVMEAQQQRNSKYPGGPRVALRVDGPVIAMQRLNRELLAQEREAAHVLA
jgi:phenylpropionate dioxygenase-like ring-hydroxylating dioxygenase large terminal subunit